MDDSTALVPLEAEYQVIQEEFSEFDTSLAVFSDEVESYIQQDVLQRYKSELSINTLKTQYQDLKHLEKFFQIAKVNRTAEQLFNNLAAWKGIKYGTLMAYMKWCLDLGYAHGTINNRLSTIRVYCVLAGPPPDGAGYIDQETLRKILTVKGNNDKKARNIDEQRKMDGRGTRVGKKKAQAVEISPNQARQLKRTTVQRMKPSRRNHDKYLKVRDAFMMGLFIEHALRVSEVCLLTFESFNLNENSVEIYRRKTHIRDRQTLQGFTRGAAREYIALCKKEGIATGPLFTGYQGHPITDEAIRKRVGKIGQELGIPNLTPHDLRHFWAFDALRRNTPIDLVQKGGAWKTLEMVVRYAKRSGRSNEGVMITEDAYDME